MPTSLLKLIDSLGVVQSPVTSSMSKDAIEKVMFNLREIELDFDRFSQAVEEFGQNGDKAAFLSAVESFSYGSLGHMEGHLNEIEALIEDD